MRDEFQSSTGLRCLLLPAALFGVAGLTSAQQFQESVGSIPAGSRWTEGVEAVDVDQDGDLDLFFAEGGGSVAPGTPEQHRLVINQLEISAGQFSDQSVARLGTQSSVARDVISGDIQGDGWMDALFANALGSGAPSLYVNQGAGSPGFFNQESSPRGLFLTFNSTAARFGDLDDDGDLDLVINDSGALLSGGAGGVPHLYTNNGSGFFSKVNLLEVWNPPTRTDQRELQLVDVDGDFDLDVIGITGNATEPRHQLMLNDGAGNFSDASALIGATGTSVNSMEPGDFDEDGDQDFFITGIGGSAVGPLENSLAGGSLGFAPNGAFAGGLDGDIGLLDYDGDDDLDVVIGSGSSSERMMRNLIGLGFSSAAGIFPAGVDSTRAIELADMDGDGAYDLVTAQGRDGSSTAWDNKLYLNTGSGDLYLPAIDGEDLPDPVHKTGPWVAHARVRDQVLDDGNDYMTAEAEYVLLTSPQEVFVTMVGLNFSPANITVAAGTTVTWDNPNTTVHTVTSNTADFGFNSGGMGIGDTYSYTFVRPGVYTYFCIPHFTFGMVGTVTVTGSSTTATPTYMGDRIWRIEMEDTLAGAATQLAYELRFIDDAGFVATVDSNLVDISPNGWTQYGLNASPTNTIDLDGVGSSSIGQAFNAASTNVTGVLAVYGIGLAPDNNPFLGGISLLDPFQLVTIKVRPVNAGASNFNVVFPNDGSLVGLDLFWQSSGLISVGPDVWEHSNGLRVTICP